jgi:hypothetical protein
MTDEVDSEPVTVTFDEETVAELRRRAEVREGDRGAVARELLDRWLRERRE